MAHTARKAFLLIMVGYVGTVAAAGIVMIGAFVLAEAHRFRVTEGSFVALLAVMALVFCLGFAVEISFVRQLGLNTSRRVGLLSALAVLLAGTYAAFAFVSMLALNC
jgi:hypothetical protein